MRSSPTRRPTLRLTLLLALPGLASLTGALVFTAWRSAGVRRQAALLFLDQSPEATQYAELVQGTLLRPLGPVLAALAAVAWLTQAWLLRRWSRRTLGAVERMVEQLRAESSQGAEPVLRLREGEWLQPLAEAINTRLKK